MHKARWFCALWKRFYQSQVSLTSSGKQKFQLLVFLQSGNVASTRKGVLSHEVTLCCISHIKAIPCCQVNTPVAGDWLYLFSQDSVLGSFQVCKIVIMILRKLNFSTWPLWECGSWLLPYFPPPSVQAPDLGMNEVLGCGSLGTNTIYWGGAVLTGWAFLLDKRFEADTQA